MTHASTKRAAASNVGLGYWMRRVLAECDRAGRAFQPDPVHDLRVALRRCRSLADGLMQLDPGRDWRAMRKSGRRLFRRLGRLRDSDPFEGHGDETIAGRVTRGSPIVAADPGAFARRSVHDVVSGPGVAADAVVVEKRADGSIALSRPWAGASGTVRLRFRHQHANYAVAFSQPVPR